MVKLPQQSSSQKQLTIRISHDVWLAVRMKALAQGETLQAVVSRALAAYAASAPHPERRT
jgi:hypothetical protein